MNAVENKIAEVECKLNECNNAITSIHEYHDLIDREIEQYLITVNRIKQHLTTDLEILQKASTIIKLERRKKYWRDHVLIRDHFACQKCGGHEHLTVHHLIPKAHCSVDMRWADYNGIVLCWECHKEWHDAHDASDNIRLFLRWLSSYKSNDQ